MNKLPSHQLAFPSFAKNQGEEERALPPHPNVPLALRIDIDREARRMAGYLYGNQIAEKFLEIYESDTKRVEQNIQSHLDEQNDPRLTEIMNRLVKIYQAQGDK